MQAKDVRPVVCSIPGGPEFHLYFVDKRHEESFVTFGRAYDQMMQKLAVHYAGRTGTISICIMPDGDGGEIKNEHIDDVRKMIAQLRDAMVEREQATEALFDAVLDAFVETLAATSARHGNPDPDRDCGKCPVTICPLNET